MAIGEYEVHVFGATWAIRLDPNLPGRVVHVVGAAPVPLVPLLDADERFTAAIGGDDVEVVVQVGRDWAHPIKPVVEPGAVQVTVTRRNGQVGIRK